MSLPEFESILKERAKKPFHSRKWSNYPNSIFYYYDDDNDEENEIAIYTNENTYGIYI